MKVLIATDGSKYAKWATGWVGRMPFAETPDVTVLHVSDVQALRAPFLVQPVVAGNEPFVQEEIKRMEARRKGAVAEAKRQLASLKLKGTVLGERGAVGPTILERAAKRDGLIALGSRGLDALDRFMLGSVSTQVMQHAPCSVLMVKEEPRLLRRMLFATDGSKESERALRFLLSKIQPDGGARTGPIEVVVVHVIPFLDYPELKEAGGHLVQVAAKKLTKVGYAVNEVVRLGKPAEEILTVASDKSVDLIVMGAKGMGAVARFFLGSTSIKVAQSSSCSTLVIR